MLRRSRMGTVRRCVGLVASASVVLLVTACAGDDTAAIAGAPNGGAGDLEIIDGDAECRDRATSAAEFHGRAAAVTSAARASRAEVQNWEERVRERQARAAGIPAPEDTRWDTFPADEVMLLCTFEGDFQRPELPPDPAADGEQDHRRADRVIVVVPGRGEPFVYAVGPAETMPTFK
jgi:hypothetical protein